MLAAVALGDRTFAGVPDRVPVAARYRPDPAARQVHDRLFGGFVGLYRRNRKACPRLNGRPPASTQPARARRKEA
jgi:xylulokinase